MNAELQPALAAHPAQFVDHAGRVPVARRVVDVRVAVDAEHRAREFRHDVGEYADHRQRVHVGADALGVEPDRERVVPGPGTHQSVRFHDVRMRQDGGGATPPCGDLLCGARGERDEPVRSGDEHVQLRLVLALVEVVRVGQVMDGVDQRLPVPA
ncbi:hypothetical protein OG249_32395 [Streptomyces microflavus]|uniref:hypothetical protein n=1 Tax=Streptomyces microflavus TaxID=1919 RepID=UPI0022555F0C|nr:hypothetical protein [Streptomyces microflavus]MCX4656587.1 hypothetical protein [Streptomyces microflavus]